MHPLLYLALFMQLAVPRVALHRQISGSAQEKKLVGQTVSREALHALYLWDRQSSQERPVRPYELVEDSTPIIIIHLWATWCAPCKEEFPLWREIGPRLERQHQRRVRIMHIALQRDTSDMARFTAELSNQIPVGRLFVDRDEVLGKNIRQALGGVTPSLPMTLWLDSQRIVRHTMVGAVKHRRDAILATTALLIMNPFQKAKKEPPRRSNSFRR